MSDRRIGSFRFRSNADFVTERQDEAGETKIIPSISSGLSSFGWVFTNLKEESHYHERGLLYLN